MNRLLPLAAAALAGGVVLFAPILAAVRGPLAPARTGPPSADPWSVPTPAAAPKARRTPAPSAVVYVAGAVRRPGVYTVPAEARVGDALARAGGGRPDADLVAVNLAARLHDGDEIAVPVLGAEPPPRSARGARGVPGKRHPRAARGTGRGARRAHRADADTPSGPPPDVVDLNSADERALQTLPGVGAALAARIVLFRAANGPFGSVDQLLDVAGITERRLELISPYVEVR